MFVERGGGVVMPTHVTGNLEMLFFKFLKSQLCIWLESFRFVSIIINQTVQLTFNLYNWIFIDLRLFHKELWQFIDILLINTLKIVFNAKIHFSYVQHGYINSKTPLHFNFKIEKRYPRSGDHEFNVNICKASMNLL